VAIASANLWGGANHDELSIDLPTQRGSMREHAPSHTPRKRHWPLALSALGVVYGDIGTSPLYALRESLSGLYGIPVTPANILGILSLIFWSLILVISVKYVLFVMRADHQGEGGILALTALVMPRADESHARQRVLLTLGLFGTALLYGDGMITPAISVLSAVEGLEVATPLFKPYIIPLAMMILVLLFLVQHRGTGTIGKWFGPVVLLWFVTLAILGITHIVQQPGILAAMNPWYGLTFLGKYSGRGFLVLGSVFLVVTGGEALYADMGHFGKRPIQLAWFALVLPALLLNYFGQGALLMSHPSAVDQPLYRMAPAWALYPLVALATTATVIASQALISGAFSLTLQAVQLGYLPRLQIDHTSDQTSGQVYVPTINWTLMAACIGLVVSFRSSSDLAAAYGVAVTLTMVLTTLLLYVAARQRWQWPVGWAVLLCGSFLVVDSAFMVANGFKIPHGGWFPLVIGGLGFIFMSTWKQGRELLADKLRATDLPMATLWRWLADHPLTRVPGTAVYLHSRSGSVPFAMLANVKYNHVLHERVAIVTVVSENVPRVLAAHRLQLTPFGAGCSRLTLHVGYMEASNVPSILASSITDTLHFDPHSTTYFLGRETLIVLPHNQMPRWQAHLFAVMSRNARNAALFFQLPPDRVIEVGVQIEL
jgi:KUP system potassium uptake protein